LPFLNLGKRKPKMGHQEDKEMARLLVKAEEIEQETVVEEVLDVMVTAVNKILCVDIANEFEKKYINYDP
jgi:hypothetical protein